MNWHKLLFSRESHIRYSRHLIFWLVWWIYFSVTNFSFWALTANYAAQARVGFSNLANNILLRQLTYPLAKSFPFFLIHILPCYAFVYIVLPAFLTKRNYPMFIGRILSLCTFIFISGYLIQVFISPFVDGLYQVVNHPEKDMKLWPTINYGLVNAQKIIVLATVIILVKRWWLKQKEKERLEKEKLEADLELLKAQINPQFLFNSLNNIYSLSLASSAKSPEMLIRLADILSYMLYECNEPLVSLEKEIKILKDYISLEKSRYGAALELNVQINGNAGNHMIAPLILLKLVENSFLLCDNKMTEQPWINLEITIGDDLISIKLLNGKPTELTPFIGGENNNLAQLTKRLELLYPGRHQFKIVEEDEIFMMNLELELERITASAPAGIGSYAEHSI